METLVIPICADVGRECTRFTYTHASVLVYVIMCRFYLHLHHGSINVGVGGNMLVLHAPTYTIYMLV